MPSSLLLHLLGTPQLYLNDSLITLQRRKSLALLTYLAIERGEHLRDTLSALLWPDHEQSKAFANLRQALWEIQKAIGEDWLNTSKDKIGLKEDANIFLDVARFEELFENSQSQSDVSLRISHLVDTVSIYRNHFLTGFSLKDSHPFNDWAYAESEELKRKFAEALTLLTESYCALDQAKSAIPYGRRLVSLDPLNESAHRQLMEVYIQAGQQSAALKQYQTLEQTLRKELNLDPQPEIRELYKKIRKGEAKPAPIENQTNPIQPKHNLPHQLSSFIGREKELTEITGLITKYRLVSLIGTGGMGKTSLSLQIGHKILNEYPDGSWFIGLDSLSDPDLVPQTIASVFDIRETPEQPVIEILVNFLREKTALLILDNCEHLLDACAELIATLLQRCPNIKVLATSREVLNVAGEATYQTPSLSLPKQDDVALEVLTQYESMRLFSERAALALSSFILTSDNAQTVMDICRKVDGIPLAIELAAARVNILQVEEILKQLNDSFGLLANDSKTASAHHQTIQASMDWSWRLLDDSEQIFLQQLSVFAGGWTLEAAQAVCEGDVLGLTNALAKKSLIVVKQASGRETRYRFHEIVRQYVREKLKESGEEANILNRHLNYFLKFSERIESGLRGPNHAEWFARTNDERDNIRIALQHAFSVDVEAGLYISGRLQVFWDNSDHREGKQWLAAFLQKPDSKDYPSARGRALLAQGWLLAWLEQFAQTRSIAQECLDIYRQCDDQGGETDALLLLGYALQLLDERETANKYYEQSLTLARSVGDLGRQASALLRLGFDQPSVQLTYWDEAIDLYRKAEDHYSLVSLLYFSARFHIVLTGSIVKAKEYIAEASQLLPSTGLHQASTLAGIANSMVAFMEGEYEEANSELQKVIDYTEASGHRMIHLWSRAYSGYVALGAGNLSEARHIFTQTAQSFRKDQNTIGVVYMLEGMASIYIALRKPELAAQLIGWADATRERIINERPYLEQADVDKNIAAIMAKIGSSAFEVAYDDGRGLTLDQAMELALNEN